MSESTLAPFRKSRRSRLALGGLVAIILGVVVALSVGKTPLPPKLPNPNGYDDFVRAGLLVKGTWPAKGELAHAPIAEVRAFVEANKPTLELARVGLTRECMVPMENSQEGLGRHMEALSPIRSVGRLLQGEGLLAEADGRIVDASRAYRDELALSLAVTQGGLFIDQMVGCAIQGQAIIGLRKVVDRLPAGEVPAILRDLEAIDRKRVPLEAIEAREDAWFRGSNNLMMRAMYQWHGLVKSGRASAIAATRKGNDRVERDLRFLMVQLAIHAYHEDKKAWPRKVGDLVPSYLIAAPIDPGTGKPIDYPANDNGELTDDLTSIARPDGEVVPSKP